MMEFPVLRRYGDPGQFKSIPWDIAEKAYLEYARRYGTDQSLLRLAQRGGFGEEELDMFYPAWREESLKRRCKDGEDCRNPEDCIHHCDKCMCFSCPKSKCGTAHGPGCKSKDGERLVSR